MFIVPAAHGWALLRSASLNGTWDVRALANLEDAAALLTPEDDFVLGLPISAVLAQRFRLPTVDPAEFAEMVRIQIEKALPFSPDEVTTDFELIEQTETDSVVSAVAVRNDQLAELAAPLINRGFIPRQVTVYAAQRAATHAPEGSTLLIYPEGEALVSAVTENGKVSLTRTLDGIEKEKLQTDLPQLTLSAELQGINASFPRILLDETCFELRDTVSGILSSPTEIVGIETPPASIALNLLPASWRARRSQVLRQAEWRKRLVWIGSAYGAAVLLFIIYLGLMRFEIGRLGRRIAKDAEQTNFVRSSETNWKALAPAIDPHYYPVEILLHLFESLPSQEVRITAYNQSARQISIDGEAKTPAQVFEFVDKVKKQPDLQTFVFDLSTPPRILSNDRAQFRLEGKPR